MMFREMRKKDGRNGDIEPEYRITVGTHGIVGELDTRRMASFEPAHTRILVGGRHMWSRDGTLEDGVKRNEISDRGERRIGVGEEKKEIGGRVQQSVHGKW